MIIAPSVLTADFTKLAQEIDKVKSADYIHIDIMDGHFVPNISFGPAITKTINDLSTIPLDVHLMVTDPINWIEQFSLSKVEFITIHIEANCYKQAIAKIRAKGKKVGISIKPNTDVDALLEIIDQVDLVLVMTVEPGFGGQSFMTDMMKKVKKLVEIRDRQKLNFIIEVDGGINQSTIEIAKNAGVDMAVAGSFVFNHKNADEAIRSLK